MTLYESLGRGRGRHRLCTPHRADELGILSEATPPSVVSGAIMMANVELGVGITRKDLAEACMVSPATVVKCYKRLVEVREHLMTPTTGPKHGKR